LPSYNNLDHCCRAPAEDQDKFIFELFNISHKKRDVEVSISKREITKEELCAMIINLPPSVIIISR
jgi:hypothetical protein